MAGNNKKVLIEVKVITSGAEKNLNNLTKETDKVAESGKKANKSFLGLGKTFGAIARGFVIVKSFQLLARAITSTVEVAAEFEQTMAKVRAISGATEKEFKQLEKSARALALGTIFTATQVGELQLAYSKLGFTTEEILNATEATLNLATATGEDLASAADVVGATIRGFNLDASEAARVADVMAASFSSSALNLENFKQSMKTVAPIASAANVDLETTTALLGTLADSGLRGTRAATGLKNLMSQLSNPTSKLAKELGYTIENSEGLIHAFRDLSARNIDLAKATGLTDERSKAAFITLVNGTANVENLKQSLDNATGSAKTMATIVGDTLSGSFKILQSQIEETQIAITNTDFLKALTDTASTILVFLRDGLDAAKGFKFDIELSEALQEEFKDVLENEKKFFSERKKNAEVFAKENQRILDEVEDKEKASQLVRERSIEQRKKSEDELNAYLLSQKELLEEKFDALQVQRDKMDDEDYLANKKRIDDEISDLENLKTINESENQSRKLQIQNLKSELQELTSEHEAHKAELLLNDSAYQLIIEKQKKLLEAAGQLEDQIDGNTESFDDLTKSIKSLNSEVDVDKFDRWQKAWHDLFPEQLKGEIKQRKEDFKDLGLELEKIQETFPEPGEDIDSALAQWLGVTDEGIEKFDARLQFVGDATLELMGNLSDLFNIQSQQKLDALAARHDAEYEMMAEAQDAELERQKIKDKHALDSFVGTQQQKADYEKFLSLQTLAFEEDQEKKRDALREKQLEKENALAKKAFDANKKIAIAEIGINLAKELSAIAANAAANPSNAITFGAAGVTQFAVMSGLAAANAALQVAAINSQKFTPKTYQDGGTIVGDSHANGGVPFTVAGQAGFEAEGGEYIFSKATVNRLGTGLLDAINFGGARPTLFADGGAVSRGAIESAAAQPTMQEMMMEAVEAFGSIPVVNVAQDTVNTNRLVENAASMARL